MGGKATTDYCEYPDLGWVAVAWRQEPNPNNRLSYEFVALVALSRGAVALLRPRHHGRAFGPSHLRE